MPLNPTPQLAVHHGTKLSRSSSAKQPCSSLIVPASFISAKCRYTLNAVCPAPSALSEGRTITLTIQSLNCIAHALALVDGEPVSYRPLERAAKSSEKFLGKFSEDSRVEGMSRAKNESSKPIIVGKFRCVAVSDQVRDRQCRQHQHASDPPLTQAE
ncbi:hypothetical protein PCH_Pc18g00090 [Penicillium rubens Wisconsin 54-1255]|uniref:Uncharacterized protein n=1 Tax=Penicillium rubens (strain ATCC 28089 / DSM 1075 / NRRL 1951 / Wisconsin 54-1255) TaxID=500485 RepID=B6GZC1_PENRW|nr:hypothetical protein PCH_Pc12g16570 [Penicillium rubens Wisconsin 54-1255]CAP94233.1 hypothetical protein PCH_Pc18g00090 [Penicillium rubens Wisconsin 54-1255]